MQPTRVTIGKAKFAVVEQRLLGGVPVDADVSVKPGTLTRYALARERCGATVLLAHWWTAAGRAIAAMKVEDVFDVNGQRWRVSEIEEMDTVAPLVGRVYARDRVTLQTCINFGKGRRFVVAKISTA